MYVYHPSSKFLTVVIMYYRIPVVSWRTLAFSFPLILIYCSCPTNSQIFPILEWAQSFFGQDESPLYTVISKISPNVEERLYPSQKWACTEEFSFPEKSDDKLSDMFRTLYTYRQGDNIMGQKISMTVPVNTKVDHRNGELNAYEMCSYIPTFLQANPPVPNSPKLRVVLRSELRVYSMAFGGYATGSVFTQKMLDLSQILTNQSLPYIEEDLGPRALHFNNIYDSPTKFWSRRNEVWLLAPVSI